MYIIVKHQNKDASGIKQSSTYIKHVYYDLSTVEGLGIGEFGPPGSTQEIPKGKTWPT